MGDAQTKETVSAEEARELTAKGDATVIDIRDDEQWSDAHIPGAVRADPDDLDAALGDVDEESGVIVVCEDGERSREVAGRLREQGREAVSIEGGMSSWRSEGHGVQPTEPGVDYEFEGPGDTQPGV